MHPEIFATFDRICRVRKISGAVLEVGATPDDSTLLNLPALAGATKKIGLNLAGPAQHRDFTIIAGNANAMPVFCDGQFDAVLCNSTLEHDPHFWLTLAEIRRVTRSGGVIVLGTPGYGVIPFERKLARLLKLFPRSLRPHWEGMGFSTLTLKVHNHPGDFYRFSEQAYREVLLAGLRDIQVETHLSPPRFIGHGVKP